MKRFSLDRPGKLSFTLQARLAVSYMEERLNGERTPRISEGGVAWWVWLLFLVIFTPGCRTLQTLPAVDLAQPGWVVRQGQAVWKSKAAAPEIAGELVLATRADGASFVQFTKTPLPFVVGQTTANAWKIQFVPENRTFSAPGKPPRRLLWLHLAECLQGHCDEKHFVFKTLGSGNQVLEDRRSGESIEFYLSPVGGQP